MKSNSKSGLFLMELMIALLIFAVCACICAAINAKASINIAESRDMSNALILAQNYAEKIKGGVQTEGTVDFYSSELTATDGKENKDTVYSVVSTITAKENGLNEYTVEVFRAADNKLIYNIDSAYCI